MELDSTTRQLGVKWARQITDHVAAQLAEHHQVDLVDQLVRTSAKLQVEILETGDIGSVSVGERSLALPSAALKTSSILGPLANIAVSDESKPSAHAWSLVGRMLAGAGCVAGGMAGAAVIYYLYELYWENSETGATRTTTEEEITDEPCDESEEAVS